MKDRLKKIFTPLNITILIWPVILWFGASLISKDTGDLLHHPFEYIFIFFIINTFGIGFVIDHTKKDTFDRIVIDKETKSIRFKYRNE